MGSLWGAFMGAVLWIASFQLGIRDIFAYIDNCFSWEFANRTLFYPPYDLHLPTKKVQLLQLWDELGVPHDLPKQEHGERLTIIGLDVDTRNMTISMPLQACSNLLAALQDFAHVGQ